MTEYIPPGDEQPLRQQVALEPTVSTPDLRSVPAEASGRTGRKSLGDPLGLRLLVVCWCLWLLASWSITLAISVPVHAVRWVVFSAVFGMMAIWPALRLSQPLPWHVDTTDSRIASKHVQLCMFATLLDWVSLVAVFQVVIWPLMLVGRWSFQQTLWLDLAVLSWTLLTSVWVSLGRIIPLGLARVGAMVLCMLLLIGEPIGMALINGGYADHTLESEGWRMRISPIQALWELTTTKQPYDPSVWIPVVASLAVAGVIAWAMLGMMSWWSRKA